MESQDYMEQGPHCVSMTHYNKNGYVYTNTRTLK